MNKKVFVVGISVFLIVIVALFIVYRSNKNGIKDEVKPIPKKEKKEKCIPFTGGSFNLIFNTNGGNEIANMHVGIAVSPDSYQELPIPEKEGFDFEGWYYDNELISKADVTSSKEIPPQPEYDNNKCMVGYKDIELFAKWTEKQ